MTEQTPPQRLRDCIADDEILELPGAYDALSARLVEQASFEAVFTSGSASPRRDSGCPTWAC